MPGSSSVDASLLRKIEPFPTHELTPYDTHYISGWHVEQYQVELSKAAQLGQNRMRDMLREMCANQVPGDTYRNLRISPNFDQRTFKHILAPIWIVAYQYRSKNYQSVVNGYTAKVAATYPKSAWKIAGLVLLAIILIATIFHFTR